MRYSLNNYSTGLYLLLCVSTLQVTLMEIIKPSDCPPIIRIETSNTNLNLSSCSGKNFLCLIGCVSFLLIVIIYSLLSDLSIHFSKLSVFNYFYLIVSLFKEKLHNWSDYFHPGNRVSGCIASLWSKYSDPDLRVRSKKYKS